MAYTLERFAEDCKSALNARPVPDALEDVQAALEKALADREFLDTHLGPSATKERDILYEDPDLGFCIIAHVYAGAKTSDPHDHGPTWAIYGQAMGSTEMTDWEKVQPPENGTPGKVRRVRTYRLEPGDARAYKPGDLHSPKRDGPTRLIRIEGLNTDTFGRDAYEAID